MGFIEIREDERGVVVRNKARFQVTPKTSHLNAVKRIFRYLKGKPKLGLWYPRVSSFNLEAYSDSDYAGANLDRKSTTGDQAKEIKHLKAQIKKLKKKAKPVITHHRAWMKSVSLKQRLAGKKSLKKQWLQKESVSKQGRKSAKAEPTVNKDQAFDELADDTLDYMESEDAQDVGRTRNVVSEEKETADNGVSTEDVVSSDKVKVSTDKSRDSTDRSRDSTDKEKDSTDRPDEGTDAQTKGRSATPTTPTPTPTTFGDDETIAQVLLNMSQAKAVSREKEKGVELKDVEETERPGPTSTRSLLTLKPLPKIDPKDKGKNKIEEEDESDTESEGIPEAEKKFKQLARDEEMARKVQEDWEAEEEVKKLAEAEATKAALSNEYPNLVPLVIYLVPLVIVRTDSTKLCYEYCAIPTKMKTVHLRVRIFVVYPYLKCGGIVSCVKDCTLHMDLCGSMRVQTINGKKYILVIVDDYSWFTWVKFLRSKDETPAVVIKFLKQIQVGLNKTVRYVRTDNGTEFVNKDLTNYYKRVSIFYQKTVLRIPKQNGIVERRNRTLVKAARTMLIFSKAPMFLWAEAVATACYTQNRSLIHTRHDKTPYELVHDKKPDLTVFSVFDALLPPTNKELEILFQPMFDEYLEHPHAERPVSPAPAVSVPVNSTGTPSSTTIDQDAPSPSHSPSSSALQSLSLHQGVAVESTLMEDNPFAPVDNNPFINVFAPEPSSEASSSGDLSSAESPYVSQTLHHLG
ncbi:retrovirus-related pol polyprotein from transposon TNT 1-94 [Tanacetum coccineum]